VNKICKKCGVEKTIDYFPKNTKMPDGYLNSCKPCEYARVAEWRKANPEKIEANTKRAKFIIRRLPDNTKQRCKKCLIEKPLTEFHVSRAMKLGVRKTCKACILAEIAQEYLENPGEHRIRSTQWVRNNPHRVRNIRRRSYEKHKVKRNLKRGEYRVKNIEHERDREKNYLKNNRPIVYAKNARRRAAETRAVPSGVTAIQKAQMQEFYEIAFARTMQTDDKYHVDHIVPLRGDEVCGLHVPWNLQVLTEFENCSKHNRLLEGST
jgi:hypothetical protein